MAKRIKIEDKFFRMRRGELVEIPKDWVVTLPILKQYEKGSQRKKDINDGNGIEHWKKADHLPQMQIAVDIQSK